MPFSLRSALKFGLIFLGMQVAGTLAQASLDTRAAVLRDASKKLWSKALPGSHIATLQVLRPEYSAQMFQLVLLPLDLQGPRDRSGDRRTQCIGQEPRARRERARRVEAQERPTSALQGDRDEEDGAAGQSLYRVGLAEELHRDEALQHGSCDRAVLSNAFLVSADENANTVSVLLGNGGGTYLPAMTFGGVGPSPSGVA